MPATPVDDQFVGVSRGELREWQSEGAGSDAGMESDRSASSTFSFVRVTGHAETPVERASPDFHLVQEEAYVRLYQVYNGPFCSEVSNDVVDKCIQANSVICNIARQADGPLDIAFNEHAVRGMIDSALERVDVCKEDRQFVLEKIIPHSAD